MGWVAIPLAVLGLAALSGGNQTTQYQYVECTDYSYGQPAYAQPAAYGNYGQSGSYYGGDQQYAQQSAYAPQPGGYAQSTSYAPASGGHYGHAGHYGQSGYNSGSASMQMGAGGASVGMSSYGSGY